MKYCDTLCQKKDWKKHKFECGVYKEFYSELHPNLDRFLLRLYLFLTNNKNLINKKEKLQHEPYNERSFEDLMTHQTDIENDQNRMRQFEAICQRLSKCIEFDKATLFNFYCKICINSFSIVDVNINEIGSGLYIAESVFDHSCTPNAAPVFNGMYLEIRAIKDIKKGEKLNINYVDLKVDLATRHESLRKQYYFDCHCIWQDFDHELLKKLNTDMDSYIDQESEWMKAYTLCQQTIDLYHQVYGHYHPDLTVQLVRLCKLRIWVSPDLDNEALELIKKTGAHIAVTHGHNHDLFKVFRKAINLEP